MPALSWQKSSFSGGPEGNCLYLATAPDGTIRLRESDEPDVALSTTPIQLAALIAHFRPQGVRPSAHAEGAGERKLLSSPFGRRPA